MRAILAALALGALTPSASAQNLTASEPQAVAQTIQKFGFKASLDLENDEEPIIESAVDGSSFYISFGGCEQGKNCDWLTFTDAYVFEKKDYAKVKILIDKWNFEQFSKSYADDDTIYIEYFLLMNQDGLGKILFNANFDTWIDELILFRKKLAEIAAEN
jgi:hypothetical protein